MAASTVPLGPLPALGAGTYELRGEECVAAVASAVASGYRLIDTAASYRNEALVGAGLTAAACAGVPRAELFIIVKIGIKATKDAAAIRESIVRSVAQLGIGYADCVLMHWPGCGGARPGDAEAHRRARRACWGEMMALQDEGLMRYMGVSNFQPHHFADVDAAIAAKRRRDPHCAHPLEPFLHQMELHPLCAQADVVAYNNSRGIRTQQYSPLGQGSERLLRHPRLLDVLRTHFPATSGDEGKGEEAYTASDLLVMWGLAQGYSTLVRSRRAERLQRHWAAAQSFFHGAGEGEEGEGRGRLPPLSEEQRGVILHLREWMGVTEDEHFCWHSSEIL